MSKRAKRLSSLEMQNVVHEVYAAHYVLMNLGFTAEELYAGTASVANWDPPGPCATVELHAQGKVFIYVVRALLPEDTSRFKRFWTEFARAQPTADRAMLDAVVHHSEVWRCKGALLGALADKGFVFPAVEEDSEKNAAGSSSPALGSGGETQLN